MENMLSVMYWGDDEEQRKKRLEQKLSEKKAKRRGEVPPPPVAPPPPPLPDNASADSDELMRQNEELLEEQKSLRHLLVQQGKVLQQILEKQNEPRYEIIKPSAEEVRKTESDPSLPQLGDIDVKVIKTDAYETQGEAGQTKEGKSIKDRAAKLRELKNKRGK